MANSGSQRLLDDLFRELLSLREEINRHLDYRTAAGGNGSRLVNCSGDDASGSNLRRENFCQSESSCQITLHDIERVFHLDENAETSTMTLDEFQTDLDKATFQWPLKPYGIEKSLSKTAIMNKGAETRVFMEQLEDRGLYHKHNPAGPLPTSLRPQLNAILQREGTDHKTVDKVFKALGGNGGFLKKDVLRGTFSSKAIDYYDFIDMVGKDTVSWPNY